MYVTNVPRLWTETIETHRREMRDAIVETAGRLAISHGLLSVTMSQIAEETGIGRATLYKYFSDVESILAAWHEGHVASHLAQLAELGEGSQSPKMRLRFVLARYAQICRERRRHGADEVAAALHRTETVAHLRSQLLDLITRLIADAAASGSVRGDVPPSELASFTLHALDAARELTSQAAQTRLDHLVWSALAVPSERPIAHQHV
jgi:AcrR family transcriptional regulator